MKNKANLFLNGTFTKYSHIDTSLYTLAADGGLHNSLKNGITPDAVIGDGDSFSELPKSVLKKANKVPYIKAADQEYTDFEKALQYLKKQGFKEINVYCFQGDRIDHMLAGLSAASCFSDLSITFFSKTQQIRKLPKNYAEILPIGTVISLLPFPFAGQVTTQGLEWELSKKDFKLGTFISISNCTNMEKIIIKHSSGCLYLVTSRFLV